MCSKEFEMEVTHEIMVPLRVVTLQAVRGFVGRIKTKATTAHHSHRRRPKTQVRQKGAYAESLEANALSA